MWNFAQCLGNISPIAFYLHPRNIKGFSRIVLKSHSIATLTHKILKYVDCVLIWFGPCITYYNQDINRNVKTYCNKLAHRDMTSRILPRWPIIKTTIPNLLTFKKDDSESILRLKREIPNLLTFETCNKQTERTGTFSQIFCRFCFVLSTGKVLDFLRGCINFSLHRFLQWLTKMKQIPLSSAVATWMYSRAVVPGRDVANVCVDCGMVYIKHPSAFSPV